MSDSQTILLDASGIHSHLSAGIKGALGDIHVFPELGSTNEWLLEQGDCGDVCLAEKQSAGRGRRGKVWQSPPRQNVYFSLRWCFAGVPDFYGSLSLAVGIAVCESLSILGLQGHGLKWPNDIYHEHRKLGGILLQTGTPVQEVVIGIGLNVNMQNEPTGIDQPWCSLAGLIGKPLDRNQLVALLLKNLIPALKGFSGLNRADFSTNWQYWDILRDREVTVHLHNEQLTGRAQGIDTQGQLLVLMDTGQQQAFSAGDVSIRL